MQTLLTGDFLKNVVGFATILCLAFGIMALAGHIDDSQPTAGTQVAGSEQQ